MNKEQAKTTNTSPCIHTTTHPHMYTLDSHTRSYGRQCGPAWRKQPTIFKQPAQERTRQPTSNQSLSTNQQSTIHKPSAHTTTNNHNVTMHKHETHTHTRLVRPQLGPRRRPRLLVMHAANELNATIDGSQATSNQQPPIVKQPATIFLQHSLVPTQPHTTTYNHDAPHAHTHTYPLTHKSTCSTRLPAAQPC